MDLTKKYIYVNPDDTAGEVDDSRLFPVSSLNRFAINGDDTTMLLAFQDAGSDDVTVVDITITAGKGKEVGTALIEEINFGKQAVIVLGDKSNNEKFHEDVDLGTAPTIAEGSAASHVVRHVNSLRFSQASEIQSDNAAYVAKVWDKTEVHTDTDLTGIGQGFGYSSPVFTATADAGDLAVTLTEEESGSVILCDADTNNITFTLPTAALATAAGMHFTFVTSTAVNASKTIVIKTDSAATNNDDNFLMYAFQGATSATDVDGDTLTIPNSAAAGTVVELTCILGGSAELWLAKVYSPATITVADS